MGLRGAGSRAQEVGHVFQKLLLAVDGSEHAAKAVPVAADIARKSDGEVLVFHVREYQVARGGSYPMEDGPEARELVDKVTAELTGAGLKARGVVDSWAVGQAARAILTEAEAEGADGPAAGQHGSQGDPAQSLPGRRRPLTGGRVRGGTPIGSVRRPDTARRAVRRKRPGLPRAGRTASQEGLLQGWRDAAPARPGRQGQTTRTCASKVPCRRRDRRPAWSRGSAKCRLNG
jgi:nucleotide-binding universal stress UspA family protein